MNVSWLTIRDLEYLVAVGKHLHFAKAAEECHVSQPALSHQVKKLEDQLGTQVFERTNRRVAVTQSGHAVLEQARRILEEAHKLGDLSRSHSEPLTGPVSIGAIATVGPYFIPLVLPKWLKRFPHAKFFLKEGLTDGLLADLKAGDLDMVIAANTFEDPSLKVFPLFHESFLLAVAKGHPLESKEPLTHKDLHVDEMVLLEDGHCLKDQTLSLCQRKGKTARSFQATSLETLKHLVASGWGYTLLPELATRGSHRMSLLSYREFPQRVGRIVVLACRKNYARLSEVELFVRYLKENLPAGLVPAGR